MIQFNVMCCHKHGVGHRWILQQTTGHGANLFGQEKCRHKVSLFSLDLAFVICIRTLSKHIRILHPQFSFRRIPHSATSQHWRFASQVPKMHAATDMKLSFIVILLVIISFASAQKCPCRCFSGPGSKKKVAKICRKLPLCEVDECPSPKFPGFKRNYYCCDIGLPEISQSPSPSPFLPTARKLCPCRCYRGPRSRLLAVKACKPLRVYTCRVRKCKRGNFKCCNARTFAMGYM